jgi:hypothetical protein
MLSFMVSWPLKVAVTTLRRHLLSSGHDASLPFVIVCHYGVLTTQ